MNETGFCTYFLYGLEIKVRWEGKGIEDEIDQLFKPFPFTQVCDAKTPVQLDLQFTTIENPANVPDSASEHVFCYGVSIFSSGDNIYITDGLSMFHLNPCEGTGTVALHHSFKKKTLIEKYNLFLIGLIHLLYPLGFYDLHAAALIRDGLGYLLIGDSLSGKSTATLSLVHQDWRYISDDAILLKPTPDGVSVLNFRKKFLIDPQLVYHYPKLAPFLEKSTNNDGSKRFLDVDSAYPGQFCPKGIPKILIFTSIVSQPESKLVPIDQTRAIIKLTNQSSSIFFNRQSARVHFDVLNRLVSQAESYQLLAGYDLFKHPEKISEVLSGIPSKTS